jgi:hypothetical protein
LAFGRRDAIELLKSDWFAAKTGTNVSKIIANLHNKGRYSMRLKRTLGITFAVLILIAPVFAQSLPQGVQKVSSIEGVTEYAYPNGLHLLLFPDSSKPKITINMVYLVGSRNVWRDRDGPFARAHGVQIYPVGP